MKIRLLLTLTVLITSVLTPVEPAWADEPDWEPVGEGIEFRRFHLPDPNNVFVARMDRSNPNVTLESSIALGRVSGGKETVRSQAARYDQAINYWGAPLDPPAQSWGSRNQVVVAINGSGFPFDTGIPEGGMVHSGWYTKRYDDSGGISGFVWKMDRSAFMGGCVYHRANKQVITFMDTLDTQPINGVNTSRGSNDLMLYTPQFDVNTGTNDSPNAVEVLVELERPAIVFPLPRVVLGIVREIRDQLGATPIPFDHVVLSAHGTARQLLLDNIQVGDQIGLSQEISNCSDNPEPSWTKAYAAVNGMSVSGCGAIFLQDGSLVPCTNTTRDPRTAIAFNDQFVYFIVVDGRDPDNSIGMTFQELGIFARDTLTATWGINQDGGGSSTMVINGRVVNNTHCNNVICQPAQEGDFKVYVPLTVQTNPVYLGAQRQVANGMMMVVVEPVAQSTVFTNTQTVTTTAQAEIRLGPGTNYGVLGGVPANTSGTIQPPLALLNGVLAKGSYWWRVVLGGVTGWVVEDLLSGPVKPPPTIPTEYQAR